MVNNIATLNNTYHYDPITNIHKSKQLNSLFKTL